MDILYIVFGLYLVIAMVIAFDMYLEGDGRAWAISLLWPVALIIIIFDKVRR